MTTQGKNFKHNNVDIAFTTRQVADNFVHNFLAPWGLTDCYIIDYLLSFYVWLHNSLILRLQCSN